MCIDSDAEKFQLPVQLLTRPPTHRKHCRITFSELFFLTFLFKTDGELNYL